MKQLSALRRSIYACASRCIIWGGIISISPPPLNTQDERSDPSNTACRTSVYFHGRENGHTGPARIFTLGNGSIIGCQTPQAGCRSVNRANLQRRRQTRPKERADGERTQVAPAGLFRVVLRLRIRSLEDAQSTQAERRARGAFSRQ